MEPLTQLELILGAIAAGVVLNGLIVKLLLSGVQKRIDDLSLRLQTHEDSCEKFREETVGKLARLEAKE